MQNTSVTAVLIGAETAYRKYVQYEIEQSYIRGNGMLGIYVNLCKDRSSLTCIKGENPFSLLVDTRQGRMYLSNLDPTYDWVKDDGYNNFAAWIEAGGRAAGR